MAYVLPEKWMSEGDKGWSWPLVLCTCRVDAKGPGRDVP